jgi:hypothetical protein
MVRRLLTFCLAGGVLCATGAQWPSYQSAPAAASGPASNGNQQALKQRTTTTDSPYRVDTGTHILLSMINSVSTKAAMPGDRIYLETAFPVLSNGHILIPQGSWVMGTVTEVKRPGRVKGRGELQVRFDSLTLPNGVSRTFKSDLGSLDARDNESLNREDSKITGPGDKKTDVDTVVGTTTAGTIIGSGVGAAAGGAARGAGIGAGAGAAAGLIGVLLTRGPEATLSKGSTVEMVLDRPLVFSEQDLNFGSARSSRPISEEGRPAAAQKRGLASPIPY